MREHFGYILDDEDVEFQSGSHRDAISILGAYDLLLAVEIAEDFNGMQHEGHHKGKSH